MLEEEEYSILDASKGEEDCVKFSDVAIVEFGNTLHPHLRSRLAVRLGLLL